MGDVHQSQRAHPVHMTVYTVVVKGELGERFSGAFEGMSLRAADGETALVGDIVDQAQLQGVLSTVADLGLMLLRVSQTDPIPSARPDPGWHEEQGEA